MFDSSELRASVENLYTVFSVYPTPEYTAPCLHCHSDTDDSSRHPDGYMTMESRIRTIAQAERRSHLVPSEWLETDTLPACLACIFFIADQRGHASGELGQGGILGWARTPI